MFRDTKTSRFPPWIYWDAVLNSPLASRAAEAGQRYPVRSLLQGNILVWYGTGFPRRITAAEAAASLRRVEEQLCDAAALLM